MLDSFSSMPRRVRSLPPLLALVALCVGALAALSPASAAESSTAATAEPPAGDGQPRWAIAIHGGAGVIPPDMPDALKQGYFDDLEAALRHGAERLAAGDAALDVVEAVVLRLEDSPRFNAGRGAVFTAAGRNELDAAIMDGRRGDAGAVASVTRVRNPIRLARAVLDESRHVFLVGEGAEVFAAEQGLETVPPSYFHTERRWTQLQEAKAREAAEDDAGGEGDAQTKDRSTVGAVALDVHGDLAAATSTGGLTNKRFGRVGDVPIVGAGTFAENETAAISCTGYGEQFIRHAVAHDVAARMRYQGVDLRTAAEAVIHDVLDPGDGGLVAVSHRGEIAMVFSSPGMFRGAADAAGRFEVAIWGDDGSGRGADSKPAGSAGSGR